MQSSFLVLKKKKKKKRLHEEMFQLSEMFFISKEEDDWGHCEVPLCQIWPEKLCIVHTCLTVCLRGPEGKYWTNSW